MPVFSLWNFPIALSLLILYKFLSSIRERRRQNAESVRRGCAPCHILPKKDLLGITRFRESIRATRAERGPKYIIEELDAEGKHIHTAQVRVLDYELNVTRDPENVRAIFSSQSQDFDIGLHRTQSWKPLLGTGIFTSQGEACTYSPERSLSVYHVWRGEGASQPGACPIARLSASDELALTPNCTQGSTLELWCGRNSPKSKYPI